MRLKTSYDSDDSFEIIESEDDSVSSYPVTPLNRSTGTMTPNTLERSVHEADRLLQEFLRGMPNDDERDDFSFSEEEYCEKEEEEQKVPVVDYDTVYEVNAQDIPPKRSDAYIKAPSSSSPPYVVTSTSRNGYTKTSSSARPYTISQSSAGPYVVPSKSKEPYVLAKPTSSSYVVSTESGTSYTTTKENGRAPYCFAY